jgi:hypothetical protein
MPPTTGYVRTPFYRIDVDGDSGFQLGNDVTQNEALEDLTTMVVEAEVVNFHGGLATGKTLKVWQGGLGSEEEMQQFNGFINRISGTSYPNTVRVMGVGELSKLRRALLSDMNLTGLTDGVAVQAILTACGVTYDEDDIYDYGYTLGAKSDIKWLKGTPGADMLREIDRVFGCATIEIGDGRVVRFAYDRAPSTDDIDYTYAPGVNAWLYNVERERGDLDAIQNYWIVTGLRYRSDDGGTPVANTVDDACQAEIWAQGVADHPKLGSGIYVAPNTFQSDIIQSEALAKMVAKRMMRWYNREPDYVVLETANDPRRTPGDVIGVRDPAYGVDLGASQNSTPYLILSVDRRGDLMTLHCVGGAAGSTGTLTSGINVCCGTEQEDGTCDDEGTNPSASPDPTISTPPDIPNEVLTPPDDADPGIPPDIESMIVCDDEEDLRPHWVADGVDLGLRAPWRESIDADWSIMKSDGTLPLDGDELVYRLVAADGGGSLYRSTVLTGHTSDDDYLIGPAPYFMMCMDVAFCGDEADVDENGDMDTPYTVSINLASKPDAGTSTIPRVIWYSAPGLERPLTGSGHDHYNWRVEIEGARQSVTNLDRAPGEISGGGLNRNTGDYGPFEGGDGLPLSPNPFFNESGDAGSQPDNFQFHHLCAAFDLSVEYQKVYVWGDGGEGIAYSEKCLSSSCVGGQFHYDVCDHEHTVRIGASASTSPTDPDFCPGVQIRNIVMGSVNCVENPNYVEPEDREFEEPDYVP